MDPAAWRLMVEVEREGGVIVKSSMVSNMRSILLPMLRGNASLWKVSVSTQSGMLKDAA